MKIIGLNGTAGSGKDTVYGMIRDALPDKVVKREAFADRLKLSAYRIFFPECTVEQAVAWAEADKNDPERRVSLSNDSGGTSISGRQYLQRYGTEAHRDVFDSDFWVDAVLPMPRIPDDPRSLVSAKYPGVDVLVITDVRFDNEAARVKDVFGEVWSIFRNAQISETEHVSEKPINPLYMDRVIPNIGSLTDLREQVEFNLGVRVG